MLKPKSSRHLRYIASAALAFILICGTAPAFAANNTKRTITPAIPAALTLDEAVAAAIAASSSLKAYAENKPIAAKNLADLYDALIYSTGIPDYVKYQSQIWQAESKRDVDAKNAQTTKQQLTVSVTQAFAAIVGAQNALTLYDRSLDLQKRQLEIAKVRLKLGMMSRNDYNTAANNYARAVSDRVSKATAIDTAFMNLNKLMGKGLTKTYGLVFEVEYEPMKKSDLDADVKAAIAASAGVDSLLSSIRITEFQIKYHSDVEPQTQTLDQLNASLSSDNRNLADARANIEQKIISQHTKIRQQEAGYETQIAALDALLAQLAVKEKQHSLGMATQIDVDNIRLSIANQEESIRALIAEHAVSVMQYRWPNTI